MSGEDAPRPYLEDLIVLEIKTNKQVKSKKRVTAWTPCRAHVAGTRTLKEKVWSPSLPAAQRLSTRFALCDAIVYTSARSDFGLWGAGACDTTRGLDRPSFFFNRLCLFVCFYFWFDEIL
jgi:hypothetical protein